MDSTKLRVVVSNALKEYAEYLSEKKFHVNYISDPNALAYTDLGDTKKKVQIYLNPNHEIIATASDIDQAAIIMGVLIHEMLHTTYTDPEAYVKMLSLVAFPKILRDLNNIVEDYTIESRAFLRLPDSGVRFLNRTIFLIWKHTPPVSDSETILSQIMSAMIQFTDMGPLVPGSKMSAEAEELFHKIAPILYEAVYKEPKERAKDAMKIYRLLEPYITPMEAMAYEASRGTEGQGTPEELTEDEKEALEGAMETVKKTVEKMSNGASSEESSKEETKAQPSSDGNSSKAEKNDGEADKGSEKEEKDSSKDSSSSKKSSETKGDPGYGSNAEEPEEPQLEEEDYELIDISDKEAKEFSDKDDYNYEARDRFVQDNSFDNESVQHYSSVRVKNYRYSEVSEETLERYKAFLEKEKSLINSFSQKLLHITSNDEEVELSKRGTFSFTRYAKTMETSVNIFSRVEENTSSDARVLVLLDVSGSMWGKRIDAAKKAIICIVEGLIKAGISVKVITHTIDDYTQKHGHYVNWKSNIQERAPLITIEADSSNYDGYAIRYAVNELKRKRAEHDLMIVISDGQPACSVYRGRNDGIEDTRNAVMEAKRQTKVIGIGIGADMNVLKHFYGKTFVQLDSLSQMMSDLSKLILKEVASWR